MTFSYKDNAFGGQYTLVFPQDGDYLSAVFDSGGMQVDMRRSHAIVSDLMREGLIQGL